MTRPYARRTKTGWRIVDPGEEGKYVKTDNVWRRFSDAMPVWITRDERKFTIESMTTAHIQACIANILIRGNWRLGYLPLLVEELERRGVGQ